MPTDPLLIAFAGTVLALAGFVKGVIGLGLPTISIGLLGLIMTPVQAAALLVVPNLVTNVWQLSAGPQWRALVTRLRPLVIGIFAGTFAGIPAIAAHTARWPVLLLGSCLMVYAALGLASRVWRVAPERERGLGYAIGALTGLVSTITGVFVVPAVPYLQGLGLDREQLVQALGASFLCSTVALLIAFLIAGQFAVATASASIAALAPALGGMLIGQALRRRIPQPLFRRWFFLGLLALGGYLALRAIA